MLLCIDIGNTNITLGLYQGETLGPRFGKMQAFDERMCRAGFRADAATPAGADDADVDLLHALTNWNRRE